MLKAVTIHFRKITLSLAWLYALLLSLWFLLHLIWGDSFWWLGLLNAFALYLFLPLLLFLPLTLIYKTRLLKPLSLPVLLFLWLYGVLFLPAWPVAQATAAPPLSVMTFNIWGLSLNPETARVILASGAPDLVALQELSPGMAGMVLKETGQVYPYHLFRPDRWNKGMGILSRYPLKELDSSHLRDEQWQVQIVEVDLPGRTITVYNCHPHNDVAWRHLKQGSSLARGIQLTYEGRRALIERLLQDISHRSTPILVLGDFNSSAQNDVYTMLANRFTDAHAAAGWGFGHTFPAAWGKFEEIPTPPRQLRLDMIFYSEEFATLSSHTSPLHGESDHLPVLAELVWRQR